MTAMAKRLLSPEERATWNEDGYLHLRGVLSSAEVRRLLAALGDVRETFITDLSPARARHLSPAGNDRDTNVIGLVRFTEAADTLLDHPGVFGRVLALMGPFIQTAGIEAMFRYAHHESLLGLHTDGGPALQRVLPESASNVIQLKVQFFLTDVSQPDSGNLVVVPGSHRVLFPPGSVEESPIAERQRQILARAGDCVIFPWALWHGVAANVNAGTRFSVIVRYAQLWCRPAESADFDDAVLVRMTPRQRRLLGHFPGPMEPSDWYRPPADQLDLMYGSELREAQEAASYFAAREYFERIYRKATTP